MGDGAASSGGRRPHIASVSGLAQGAPPHVFSTLSVASAPHSHFIKILGVTLLRYSPGLVVSPQIVRKRIRLKGVLPKVKIDDIERPYNAKKVLLLRHTLKTFEKLGNVLKHTIERHRKLIFVDVVATHGLTCQWPQQRVTRMTCLAHCKCI